MIRRATLLTALATLAAACSPPIGIRWVGPRAAQQQLTSNELTTGEPSVPSRIVLGRRGRVHLERSAEVLAREAVVHVAYIEGVESKLVVRSSHSVQGNPSAIEEVRRILLLHDAQRRDSGDACRPGGAAALAS